MTTRTSTSATIPTSTINNQYSNTTAAFANDNQQSMNKHSTRTKGALRVFGGIPQCAPFASSRGTTSFSLYELSNES